jgi:hypothetical protein
MSQISGKWIEDGAITPSKIDTSAVYTFSSIDVTGDATVGGNLQISELSINQTLNQPALEITTTGSEPALVISTTGSLDILSTGTSYFPDIVTDTISPVSTAVTIASELNVSNTLNNSTLYSLVENSGTGIGTGSEIDAIVGDSTIGMRYSIGGSAGAKIGTFSNDDFKIVRNNLISAIIQTDEGGNPLLNVVSPTTLLHDVTSSGNFSVENAINGGNIYNITENLGTGSNTTASVFAIVGDNTVGLSYNTGHVHFPAGAWVGTYSDNDLVLIRDKTPSVMITTDADGNPLLSAAGCPSTLLNDTTVAGTLNVVETINHGTLFSSVLNTGAVNLGTGSAITASVGDSTVAMQYVVENIPGRSAIIGTLSDDDLNVVRNSSRAVVITTDANNSPELNVLCPTTLTNDMTATGNMTVVNSLNGGVVYNLVQNNGAGNNTGATILASVGNNIVGLSYNTGHVHFPAGAWVGTYSNNDLILIRDQTPSVAITTDGITLTPQFNIWTPGSPGFGCPVTVMKDATVTDNINIANLPIHVNNSDASSGGLVAGDLYRTGGDPDLVCVVH